MENFKIITRQLKDFYHDTKQKNSLQKPFTESIVFFFTDYRLRRVVLHVFSRVLAELDPGNIQE